MTSPDGVTWTRRNSGTSSFLGCITHGGGQFVARGNDGTIVTSPDGVAWTRRTSGTDRGFNAITYGNGTFVGVGWLGIMQSGVVVPIQPVLGPLRLLSGGAAQVTLTGVAGQTYPIQASINLADWLPLTNVTLIGSSGEFADPAARTFPQRFYRAVGQ
jgi:hypothetical protein